MADPVNGVVEKQGFCDSRDSFVGMADTLLLILYVKPVCLNSFGALCTGMCFTRVLCVWRVKGKLRETHFLLGGFPYFQRALNGGRRKGFGFQPGSGRHKTDQNSLINRMCGVCASQEKAKPPETARERPRLHDPRLRAECLEASYGWVIEIHVDFPLSDWRGKERNHLLSGKLSIRILFH